MKQPVNLKLASCLVFVLTENWDPMGWDRAAEELTWERLLGLDGSLIFLEHVFWVVSLNTLFVLIFG